MTADPMPVNIFYCYAHEDKELRDSLDRSLSTLKRNGQIIGWYDRQISPGQNWANEIDNNLNKADIILLLVSPDFMYSDYCYGIEMKRALERQRAGEARVIPIILRTTDLEDASFSHLQMLPTDTVPVMKWPNRDDAFYDIVKGIRQALKELRVERLVAQGRALRKSQRFDEALSLLDQAIQLDAHNANAFYEKGSVYLDRGNPFWKEAISAFDEAIRLDPAHAQAYFGKGRALYTLTRYTEALAAFEKAIQYNPAKLDFYSWQAASFEALGKNEEALATYERAAHFDNLTLLWKQAELLEKLNRSEELVVVLEHILSLKNDARAFRWLGNELNRIERYEDAVATYDKAISLYSDRNAHKATCYNGKGNALYQLHRLEEALAAYDKAIQINPGWSTLYRNKGNIYERLAQEMREKADEIEGKS